MENLTDIWWTKQAKSIDMIPLDEVQKQAKLIHGNKVRTAIASRAGKRVLTGEQHEGAFWGSGNSLYLDVMATWDYRRRKFFIQIHI